MPLQRDDFVHKVHYPKQYNVGYSKNSNFIYIDSVINFHLKLQPSRGEGSVARNPLTNPEINF